MDGRCPGARHRASEISWRPSRRGSRSAQPRAPRRSCPAPGGWARCSRPRAERSPTGWCQPVQQARAQPASLPKRADLHREPDRTTRVLVPPTTVRTVSSSGLHLIPPPTCHHWSASTVWPSAMQRCIAFSARSISLRSWRCVFTKTVSSTIRLPDAMYYVIRTRRRSRLKRSSRSLPRSCRFGRIRTRRSSPTGAWLGGRRTRSRQPLG